MTATIKPKSGFDWSRVKWGAPNERRTTKCSYCGAKFPDDDDSDFVSLIMWSERGWCVEFCDDCQATWWGVSK
jgi:hypothetical protein